MRRDRTVFELRGASSAAAIAVAFILLVSVANPALADEAIAEREGGLECAACHSKPPRAKLNDRGMYYEAVGTLDGFAQLSASFGKCTHCHSRRAGARKLTKAGKRFKRFVGDMQELREWLESMHPPFGTDVGGLAPGVAERVPTLVACTNRR